MPALRGYRRRPSSRYSARPYKRRYSRRVPSASRKKLRAIANLRTGGQLGIERKYFDCKYNSSSATVGTIVPPNFPDTIKLGALQCDAVTPSTATVYYLNCPGVGSSAWQRDGRVIRNHSIEISGHVTLQYNALTPAALPNVCIALILDTQCNGQSPYNTVDNIYTDIGGGLSVPFRNMSQTTRYRVLAFKRIALNLTPIVNAADALTENSGVRNFSFKMYRKLGFKTNFKTTESSPSATAIIDNGIFLAAWDDYNIFNPKLYVSSRLRFTG
jgi:hypothetical protein